MKFDVGCDESGVPDRKIENFRAPTLRIRASLWDAGPMWVPDPGDKSPATIRCPSGTRSDPALGHDRLDGVEDLGSIL
jgi:hypothetical protein